MSWCPWGAACSPCFSHCRGWSLSGLVTWGQQWHAAAGSDTVMWVTQPCSVQHPLLLCCRVQKHILGRQSSMCSSGLCHSLWRKAEQCRLSEVWHCLCQGCAARHREHHGQGRKSSGNALLACCFQGSLLGLELSSTGLTECLPLLTTPSGSSSCLCPTCSSQREHFLKSLEY